MSRFKLTLEYDGTGLVGWQRQDNGPSVQAMLEAAAERLTGQAAQVQAAGRTDAGVHALGQVAHVDIDKPLDTDRVRDALNFWLRSRAEEEGRPPSVCVVAAELVADDFHARFSAISRHYLYRILNRRPPPMLDRDRVWWVARPLDVAAMSEAAKLLIGHHDFSTFRAAECQAASPVKTLDYLTVEAQGEEIHIRAGARSFLHHQVRNMTGSLALVGDGRWQPADLGCALEAKDRTKGGPTAPASGLYFVRVEY